MEKSVKFLGICILIGIIILSGSLIYNKVIDRYSISSPANGSPVIIDKFSGDAYFFVTGSDGRTTKKVILDKDRE